MDILTTILLPLLLFFATGSHGKRNPPGKATRGAPTIVDSMSGSVMNSSRDARLGLPRPFGAITRDEWLAKEYFGYLCAPNECIPLAEKTSIREKCFDQHEKVLMTLSKCFGPEKTCSDKAEERSMACVMMASKQDPQLVPLPLHDCVDEMVTMKHWKCIRRHFMERMKSMMDMIRGKKNLEDFGIVDRNVTVSDASFSS